MLMILIYGDDNSNNKLVIVRVIIYFEANDNNIW